MKTQKKKVQTKKHGRNRTSLFLFHMKHLSNNLQNSEIHRIIKRPNTNQSDIVVQIPYAQDGTGPTRETLKRNLEYMLISHEIPQSVAGRMTSCFINFMDAVEISTQSKRGIIKILYFKVTDNTLQGYQG